MQRGKILKDFKVVAVSSNTNSFGLRGMVVVARDGEAWELGANSLNVRPIGDVVHAQIFAHPETGERSGTAWEYEIPRELPRPPKNLIEEIWR